MRILIAASVVATIVFFLWSGVYWLGRDGQSWLPPEKPWQKKLREALATVAAGFIIILLLAFVYVIVHGIITTT